jgi:hypothetical protein
MNRLTASKAPTFFRLGLAVQLAAVNCLVHVVSACASSIWLVGAPVAGMVASFGLTGPSGSSLYMSHFDKLAGSASSFFTTSMFATGAIFGSISGMFFDGTLVPMVVTMLAASCAANLLGLRTRA